MAVSQPLASSMHDISIDTLRGTVHFLAPEVQCVHAALDACADEAGPVRFEEVKVVELPGDAGSIWLLGSHPSPALMQLVSSAPGVRDAFGKALGLPSEDQTLGGHLVVTGGQIEDRPGTVDISVFLSMLERDPQTTPSSLENLFDGLEVAKQAGLLDMDAGNIGLTPDGRKMILDAGRVLDAASEHSIGVIDLYAQEVADGRLSLRNAIIALGEELGLALPEPGQEVEDNDIAETSALVRVATAGLRPIVDAAQVIPEEYRLDVVVAGLTRALVELGVNENLAADRVRNDLRILRLFGASLSHGLPTFDVALRRLIPDHQPMLDLFHERLGRDAAHMFLLERAVEADVQVTVEIPEDSEVPSANAEQQKPESWLMKLLRRLGFS